MAALLMSNQSGTVSVTMVHADKIPMTPNFGQQPRFIITVQPAGVTFQPPAALAFPNTDGLAPGVVTELYSFDHDLGQFVSIGTASVSEDGSQLVADPGVGIIKGGWHCGGDPNDDPGCASGCQECQTCNGSSCDTDPALDGNSCTSVSETRIACCSGGRCDHCPEDNACLGIKHVCGAGQGCQDVTPRTPKDCNDHKDCTIDQCEDGNCTNPGAPICEDGFTDCLTSTAIITCQVGCIIFPDPDQRQECLGDCLSLCADPRAECLRTCFINFPF